MSEYLYGATVRLGNTFTDTEGDVYDPDTLELEIFDAEGTSKKIVTYAAAEIIKDETGIYHYDYTAPSDSISQGYWIGVWTITITSTGQVDISEEQFYVRPPAEKLYISVDEVKSSLMSTGVTMDDDDVRNCIRSAMSEVDVITGRSFMNGNTKTEWFSTNQANPNNVVNMIFLTYLPVQSITSLKEYNTSKELVTTHTSDDYWIDDNGILELTTGGFTHQRNRVECVYTYGYTSVPIKISKLCSIIAQIEVMRNYMIAQDDKIVGLVLIAEIGNLRNMVFAI